jgi:hypothetical protein
MEAFIKLAPKENKEPANGESTPKLSKPPTTTSAPWVEK